jgi:choline-sulfatase
MFFMALDSKSILISAILLSSWLATLCWAEHVPSSRPDIFLVTIDTLRADHIQCYGYKDVQTPVVDGLARDGIRFAAAFTPAPLTNPAHASILTGNWPSTHGVTDFGVPLDKAHPSLAELLKSAGYHTAAFIGAIILDSRKLAPGLNRGFDYYDNFPQRAPKGPRWGRLERRGGEVVSRAEQWLDAHPRGPRFVWIHLFDPHAPYLPPIRYLQLYRNHPYDGEIAYADAALGLFVRYLKQHRSYQEALIILVGDHGESLGEHSEATHGIFLYDSTLHVPLILKLPQERPGATVITSQVRTIDIVPTVLDVISVGIPQIDGESLLPLFTRGSCPDRPAFGETDYPLRFGWAPLRSLRNQGFKLIEAPRPELYELGADPQETHNIYEPWNQTVKDFRHAMAAMRYQFRSSATSPVIVPQSTINELRALGYLEPQQAIDVPAPSRLPDPKDKIAERPR